MAHWFDSLCKELAQESALSRRGAIGGALAGILATSWVGRAAAQTPAKKPAPTRGPCTRQISKNGDLLHDFTVAQGAYSVRERWSFGADGIATSEITATQNGKLIYQIQTNARKGGSSTSTITYAAGVVATKSATATTTDGKTFRGTLDSRAFTATAAPKSVQEIRFDDGKAAPAFQVDQGLASELDKLRPLVAEVFNNCAAGTPNAPRIPHKKTPQEIGYPRTGANQEGYTYLPGGTSDGPGCTNCYNECGQICQDAEPGVADIFVCPPCAAAQSAAALVAWGICCGVCNIPGVGGCCPVSCGTLTCCFSGDTCFGDSNCCYAPSIVCNGACCTEGITKCAPDGTCGCGDYKICGSWCCPPDDQCCDGQTCCPKGNKCCGQTCVPENEKCCGSSACVQGETCQKGPKGDQCCIGPLNAAGDCCGLNIACGSTCCQSGTSVCVKDHCCPSGQACGDVCCPSGSSCADAKKGTCGKVCPPGVASCNGQCCPAASDKSGAIVCCYPQVQDVAPFNNSNYGCHHNFACIPPAPK